MDPDTVSNILDREEYLAKVINFRTKRKSYKTKKSVDNPRSEWAIFDNIHEPIIDEETMHLQHDKHHQTYVNNANKGLENTEFKNHSAEGLLRIFNELPEEIRPLVRQNVGGHYNHSLYWQILGGEGGEPNGQLLQAIEQTFGSFSEFQQQFLSVATGRFGSGWAWLVVNNGELELVSTPNQDSPLMDGLIPIFGVDVWEHAYYLNYRNVRPDYIKAIWKIVNWDKVSELYEKAL